MHQVAVCLFTADNDLYSMSTHTRSLQKEKNYLKTFKFHPHHFDEGGILTYIVYMPAGLMTKQFYNMQI